MTENIADFPAKLRPLFEPKRYKVMHGGRGGAKSWGVARALLLTAAAQPLRILCAREVQRSRLRHVNPSSCSWPRSALAGDGNRTSSNPAPLPPPWPRPWCAGA